MPDVFQPKFVDLVRNYSTTTGTGDFVLGPAVTGFASFTDACQVGDQFYYAAIGVDKPSEREVGRGTLLANGAIARNPAGGTRTDFTSASKSIALVAAAEWFGELESMRTTAQPIAVCDFKNGIYLLNGKPVSYADLWDDSQAVGTGAIVPGIGYTWTRHGGGVVENYLHSTALLVDAVAPESGFSAVIDCGIYTQDVEGAPSVNVEVAAYNDSNFANNTQAGVFFDPPSWGGSGQGLPFAGNTDGSAFERVSIGDIHRVAASLGPEMEHISANGGQVHSVATPRSYAGLNALYIDSNCEASQVPGAWVIAERVAFYPLLKPELLPSLSARGLSAPSGPPGQIAHARQFGGGVVLDKSGTAVPHTGDTSEVTLISVTIPAGSMGINGRIEIDAALSWTSNANLKTIKVKFGGTTLTVLNATNTVGGIFQGRIANRGTATAQHAVVVPTITNGTGSPSLTTPSLDTTVDQTVTITGQLASTGDAVAVESYRVLLYPEG